MQKQYIAGIDGGGTKTACMISDVFGKRIAYSVSEASNHQIVGVNRAMENILDALQRACAQLEITLQELSFVFLGLAGADLPEDFDLLNGHLAQILCDIPFRVVNDSWVAFSSGTESEWGAVSICGTGFNMAVKDPQGVIHSVRALGYMLGNYGGGITLTDMAMHRAFRADEKSGVPTRLTEVLPAYCDCATMDELAKKVYDSNCQYHKKFNISKLIFKLAYEGDEVCFRCIHEMAEEMGDMLGRFIASTSCGELPVPIVLSGSLYTKDEHQLLITPMEAVLRRFVPHAILLVNQNPPAFGALSDAFRAIQMPLSTLKRAEVLERIRREGII